MNKFKEYLKEIFYLDLRSLALTRVMLAAVLIYDFITRIPFLEALYTDKGIVTRQQFITRLDHGWNWSIFLTSGNYTVTLILYSFMLYLFFKFLIGHGRTVLSILIYIFVISISNRNWTINNSGDDIYRVIAFIFIFLPFNHYYSVDSALGIKKDRDPKFVSYWTFAYILQLSLVYLVSYAFKTGDDWRVTYDGTYMAFSLEVFARSWVEYLLKFPKLLKVLTFIIVYAEGFLPYLLFLSFNKKLSSIIRYTIIAVFVGFHATLITAMKIGAFPWICIALWLGLLPGHFWETLSVRFNKNKTIIYYDGECGFCKKGVLLMIEFLLFRNVEMRMIQSSREVENKMMEFNSWVVRGSDDQMHIRFEAFLYLLKNNSIFSFLFYIFNNSLMRFIGTHVYIFVSSNRRLFSKLTKGLKPKELSLKSFNSILLSLVGVWFVISIAFWNLHELKWYRKNNKVRNFFISSTRYFNLFQYWGMFSPKVRDDEGYLTVVGKLSNGQEYDLFHDIPIAINTVPECLSCEYESKEWRKFFMNMIGKRAYSEFYGVYTCQSWNKYGKNKVPAKLEKVEIDYHYRKNFRPGSKFTKSPWVKKHVWTHDC